MKKTMFYMVLVGFVALIASCEYDDSNDIDILKPNDSTSNAILVPDLPK